MTLFPCPSLWVVGEWMQESSSGSLSSLVLLPPQTRPLGLQEEL